MGHRVDAVDQVIDQVVDAFGGAKTQAANNKVVAAWLGLNTSAVCNWRERNSIPSGGHLRFYLDANERGMEIEPFVFGLECEFPAPAKKAARRKRKKRR